jgi:chemotaxis protein methyltransferase CheR
MRDPDCVGFLQWALPRMGLRWQGFRRVRGQVCKRIGRRLRALGIVDLGGYVRYLEEKPEEWRVLEGLCRVSISRFYRDRAVFDALADPVLPALAAEASRDGERRLEAWSAGCAAGEEPYTLALVWQLAVAARVPGTSLRILATDADPNAVQRAASACYQASSLKELPAPWRDAAFEPAGGLHRLRPEFRGQVELRCQDIRTAMPDGPFDLVLCRNLVFTYFDEPLREQVARGLVSRLRPRGLLIVGAHEVLDHAGLGLLPLREGSPTLWRLSGRLSPPATIDPPK